MLKTKVIRSKLHNYLPSKKGFIQGIRNFRKLKISEKALVVLYIFVFLFGNMAPYIPIPVPKTQEQIASNPTYQNPSNGEKVADGVWKNPPKAPNSLPNPIKQVLASAPKEDLNIRVSSIKYIVSSNKEHYDTESYRYSVKLSNGTVFAFGQEISGDKDHVLPKVRIQKKDGQFISYSPKYQILNTKYNSVTPTVKGNVIEWKIADGILARYTVKNDRVKEDLIIDSKEDLKNFPDFNLNTSKDLKNETMPNGDISFLDNSLTEVFTIPAPIINDANKKQVSGKYAFAKNVLSINFKISSLVFPITVDPVVLDNANVNALGTGYGNGRKIIRDAWGNLIAVFPGSAGGTDMIFYKNYNSSTWVTSTYNNGEAGVEQSVDIDSSGNLHFTYRSAGNIKYKKVTVARSADNTITSSSSFTGSSIFALDSSAKDARSSLIIANKGGGTGVEKVAVAYSMQDSVAPRSEIRFMMCAVSDDCSTAANWYNASKEIDGSGTCSDTVTSGAAGLPNAPTCKGTADNIQKFNSNTAQHVSLMQMPGVPKRSPTKVWKFVNAGTTYTDLTNAYDNNTGTAGDISSLTSSDFVYVGDNKTFSKMVFDLTNMNSTNFAYAKYCSAVDGSNNCTTWTAVPNSFDNATCQGCGYNLSRDGSWWYDLPTNWVQSNVNGVTKYWIQISFDGLDASVSIAELYLTDRNSKSLILSIGTDGFGLGATYIVWDEINNDRWEAGGTAGRPWDGSTSTSSIDSNGGAWSTWTNFPLSSTVDYINNRLYVGYMSGTAVGSSNLALKSISNVLDPITSANWTASAFPATTEAATTNLSLTSDGQNLYIFYVLNPGTNAIVYQRCNPATAGLGNICDNASDWGSASTLDATTTMNYPQAVVTKATGDNVAIDAIYTNSTGPAVDYERVYVNSADASSPIVVAASGDDAQNIDCQQGTDTQSISDTASIVGSKGLIGSCGGINQNGKYHSGFRFSNITVSQGAMISSAYIDLRVSTVTGTSIQFTIFGDNVDNSASFTLSSNCLGDSNCIQNRSTTTSSYSQALSLSTNTYRFNVTNIVQEIVCRGAANAQPCVGNFNKSGNWASGNALSLLLIATENYTGNLVNIDAFDGTTPFKPTLQINVAPSGTTGLSYSLGSATQIATGSASLNSGASVQNLSHPFSTNEFGAVSTNDTLYASVSATTQFASGSAQPIFMFKVNNSNNNNTLGIDASVIVKSTNATSNSPAYLQVYRGGSTNDWVTMATDNATAANTDFTLTAQRVASSLSEYYFNETPGIGTQYAACTTGTANCWSYWRVYQDVPGANYNEILSVNQVSITYVSLGPTKLAFSVSSGSTTAGVCTSAFTVQTQDASSTPINPLTSTVVSLSSNSPGTVTFWSVAGCGSGSISTLTFNGTHDQTFYLKDTRKSPTTWTLTVSRTSGDTLTDGTTTYAITAAAASKYIITLPGETFTDGVGNSGSPSNRTAGTSFAITSLSAVDANNNVDPTYTGAKTVSYSGPANAPDSTPPSYTTAVTFASGQSTTTLTTTLNKAETTTITATATSISANPSSSVTIVPGSVTGANSTVTGSASAYANTSYTVTITIMDAHQNLKTSLSGANISLANSTGTGFYVGSGPTDTNGSGVSTASVLWNQTGSKVVKVDITGDGQLTNTLSVTVGENPSNTSIGGGVQIKGGTQIR